MLPLDTEFFDFFIFSFVSKTKQNNDPHNPKAYVHFPVVLEAQGEHLRNENQEKVIIFFFYFFLVACMNEQMYFKNS